MTENINTANDKQVVFIKNKRKANELNEQLKKDFPEKKVMEL